MLGATGAVYFIFSSYTEYYVAIGYFSGLVSAALTWFIPESPKYLLSMKRYEKATQILNKLAIRNRVNETAPMFASEEI